MLLQGRRQPFEFVITKPHIPALLWVLGNASRRIVRANFPLGREPKHQGEERQHAVRSIRSSAKRMMKSFDVLARNGGDGEAAKFRQDDPVEHLPVVSPTRFSIFAFRMIAPVSGGQISDERRRTIKNSFCKRIVAVANRAPQVACAIAGFDHRPLRPLANAKATLSAVDSVGQRKRDRSFRSDSNVETAHFAVRKSLRAPSATIGARVPR